MNVTAPNYKFKWFFRLPNDIISWPHMFGTLFFDPATNEVYWRAWLSFDQVLGMCIHYSKIPRKFIPSFAIREYVLIPISLPGSGTPPYFI